MTAGTTLERRRVRRLPSCTHGEETALVLLERTLEVHTSLGDDIVATATHRGAVTVRVLERARILRPMRAGFPRIADRSAQDGVVAEREHRVVIALDSPRAMAEVAAYAAVLVGEVGEIEAVAREL